MKHNWEYKRLGEVAPSMPYKGYINPINGKYWCLNLDKIEVNSGKVLDYDFVEETELDGSVHKFTVGNVLFSKLRPNLNKVIVPEQNGYCTTELVPLRPLNILNRYFLAYYLRNPKFVDFLIGKTGGAKMPRVKMDIFWNTAIPVPPMEVQEQIVAELDKINEVICDCRKLLYNLDALAQSLFYDTFGDPVTNPKGWPMHKLFEECIDIVDGDHSAPPKAESGIPFITISNIDKSRNSIDFSDTFFVPQDYYNNLKENRKARKGDVLYTVTGSYGITVLINNDEPFCFQRHIGLLRPKKTLNSVFLAHWGRTEAIKHVADSVATGIAQKTVSLSSLRKFPIIIPPLSLQNQFAAKVERIEEQKKAVEATIAELQTLLDSRMDYWFN